MADDSVGGIRLEGTRLLAAGLDLSEIPDWVGPRFAANTKEIDLSFNDIS